MPLDFASLCVLVVDDQEFVRKMVGQYLRTLGCREVFEAADGNAAIDMCVRCNPDLVLCDINMKPANGFDFLRAARSGDQVPDRHVPVIFLTSAEESGTVMKAHALEANGFLTKPVKPAALREKIEVVMPPGGGTAGKLPRNPNAPPPPPPELGIAEVTEILHKAGFGKVRAVRREGAFWHADAHSDATNDVHVQVSPYSGQVLRHRRIT